MPPLRPDAQKEEEGQGEKAMMLLAGILTYIVGGSVTVGVMTAQKQFDGESKGTEGIAFVAWPLIVMAVVSVEIFSAFFSIGKYLGSPRKAKPKASPSTPVIDPSSVPPLPDPEDMPDEWKGKR